MKMPVSDTVEREQSPDGVIAPAGYGPTLLKKARQVVVFVLGISVLAVGIVMIVAPGPAVVVIPLGLGILATEFLWARRVLDSLKRRLADAHAATAQAPLPRWMRFLLPKKSGDA
jgi:uncharacterized protein (TIGR02611 family)